MIGPLKTMTAFIRKFRRKRKLSTELHSRWGDVSITYPTEGSWSQWDQPSGFVANNANPVSSSPEEGHRHGSFDSHDTASYVPRTLHQDTDGDKVLEDSAMTIPTGHYDARLRYGAKDHSPPYAGHHHNHHHVNGSRPDPRPWSPHSDSEDDHHGSPPPPNHRHRCRYPGQNNSSNNSSNNSTNTRKALTETTPISEPTSNRDRTSKSPPLSVTSRMRRQSQQSNSNSNSNSTSTSTEPPLSSTFSMPNTASSQNTSFAPSSCLSPVEDSRVGCNYNSHNGYDRHNGHNNMAMNTTTTTSTGLATATATATAPPANTYQERKLPLRKYHEPDTLVRQELVPSYDELYG